MPIREQTGVEMKILFVTLAIWKYCSLFDGQNGHIFKDALHLLMWMHGIEHNCWNQWMVKNNLSDFTIIRYKYPIIMAYNYTRRIRIIYCFSCFAVYILVNNTQIHMHIHSQTAKTTFLPLYEPHIHQLIVVK